ncbi:MAG: hypothetical protein ABJL99_13080 [Aliishimia sp.]
MMFEIFSEFAWHDADIVDIKIDRSEPDHKDIVSFGIRWGEWQPRSKENTSIVEFSSCYALDMEMNVGIIALETIKEVWLESEHSKFVNSLKLKI